MPTNDIYAVPREVTDINECYFYHKMDIPGYGEVGGAWDLRDGVHDYLGGIDFKGKRVLELGTASGFLCFYMEKLGAEVVAFDLSEKHLWDLVPYWDVDFEQMVATRKEHNRQINNGFWFNHRAFQSNAKVVYGSVYEIPEQIGEVDITTLGSILLHVRDPFLVLQNALRLTKETVIITDRPGFNILIKVLEKLYFPKVLLSKFVKPSIQFLPDYRKHKYFDTWWRIPPKVLIEFIGILGFENVEMKYHIQKYRGDRKILFTIVGHRKKA